MHSFIPLHSFGEDHCIFGLGVNIKKHYEVKIIEIDIHNDTRVPFPVYGNDSSLKSKS